MLKTFRDLAVFAGLVAFALLVVPRLTVPAVIRSAEAIAAGRPYCIDIPREPDRSGYVALESIVDLGALRMRTYAGDHGLYWSFHGVLYVDGENGVEHYNWSYAAMRFLPFDNRGGYLLNDRSECERRVDFIDHLLGL